EGLAGGAGPEAGEGGLGPRRLGVGGVARLVEGRGAAQRAEDPLERLAVALALQEAGELLGLWPSAAQQEQHRQGAHPGEQVGAWRLAGDGRLAGDVEQ